MWIQLCQVVVKETARNGGKGGWGARDLTSLGICQALIWFWNTNFHVAVWTVECYLDELPRWNSRSFLASLFCLLDSSGHTRVFCYLIFEGPQLKHWPCFVNTKCVRMYLKFVNGVLIIFIFLIYIFRLESLMGLDRSHIEDETLRHSSWYQAGIPR